MTPRAPHHASTEALFRFLVISNVLGRVARGEVQVDAVQAVSAHPHPTLSGALRTVGKRTVYRWLEAFRAHGLAGLEPAGRKRIEASAVLPSDFLDFLADQRQRDPRASIPQLIASARQVGVLAPTDVAHRSTVWRAMARMRLETRRRMTQKNRDARRFAYAHNVLLHIVGGMCSPA